MVQKILTVEELDVMIATEPKTESGHEESMKRMTRCGSCVTSAAA